MHISFVGKGIKSMWKTVMLFHANMELKVIIVRNKHLTYTVRGEVNR